MIGKEETAFLFSKKEEMGKLLRKISEDRIIFAMGIMIVTAFMGATLIMIVSRFNFFDYILLGILAICAYAFVKVYRRSKKENVLKIKNILREIEELTRRVRNKKEASL